MNSMFFANPPAYLARAEALAERIRAEGEAGRFVDDKGKPLNRYGQDPEGPHLSWGKTASACARCNTFLTLLLEDANPGWTPKKAGFRMRNPMAGDYHDAIARDRYGFHQVTDFAKVQPGDILAARYYDPSRDTGHIMIVRHATPGTPDADGTIRWEVDVVDCSSGKHSEDTRIFPNRETTGVGEGKIGIYTRDGKITGYTWSLKPTSPTITPEKRHLVLGEITPASPRSGY